MEHRLGIVVPNSDRDQSVQRQNKQRKSLHWHEHRHYLAKRANIAPITYFNCHFRPLDKHKSSQSMSETSVAQQPSPSEPNLFRVKEKEFQQKITATVSDTPSSKKRKTVRPIAMADCNFVDVRRPDNDASVVTQLAPVAYRSTAFHSSSSTSTSSTSSTQSEPRTVRRFALTKHPGTVLLIASSFVRNRLVRARRVI